MHSYYKSLRCNCFYTTVFHVKLMYQEHSHATSECVKNLLLRALALFCSNIKVTENERDY